ncbi:hypothetical protein [Ralstonia pseudosolanacearum]|uniref:Ankyrin repeat domain-containing protein n=1 Tax=Ralstonia solanacearum TaxID=305 RepID=A0ABY6NFQ5_RALSL|nr:hypothetical protein LH706_06795 [Ralstonia solanacearum]
MKTEAYVDVGKVVTDHIAPINAVMTASTAILLPTLDFVRPHFPYINQVALLAVAAFLALLAMRLLKIPKDRQLRPSVLLCAGVCAAAFSIGAVASTRHAEQGGLAAATFPWVSDLQKTLLDIKNGKSDDPRVELKNIGVEWKAGNLLQASKDGDLRVIELFLKGGMPVTLNGTGNDRQLPFYVVANNYPKAKEQLELFKKYGVDLNDQSLVAFKNTNPATQPPNLYAVAKDNGNENLAAYLAQIGLNTDSYQTWHRNHPK